MRTAAGVLLILVAMLNLFAALFYFTVGAGGKLSAMAAEQQRRQGREPTAESRRSAETLRRAPEHLGTTGGKLMAYSLLLAVTVGTSIAGAVCLFRQRSAAFVIASAVLLLISELVNAVMLKFGWGNAPGVLAAVFALIGARSIIVMSRPVDVPPPGTGLSG